MSWRGRVALAMAGVLLVLGVAFGRPPQPHFWWDSFPAFWALFGFAGAWLLALLAKRVAARWLERSEGYYDD